jgi:hypothetical protein
MSFSAGAASPCYDPVSTAYLVRHILTHKLSRISFSAGAASPCYDPVSTAYLVRHMLTHKLTKVLQFPDEVMTQIQCVQQLKIVQVLNLMYHIVLQVQVAQGHLIV